MQLENQSAGSFKSWLWLCYYFFDLFLMDTGLIKYTLLIPYCIQNKNILYYQPFKALNSVSELHFQPDILFHSYLHMWLQCFEKPSHSAHVYASFSLLRANDMPIPTMLIPPHIRIVLDLQARRSSSSGQ